MVSINRITICNKYWGLLKCALDIKVTSSFLDKNINDDALEEIYINLDKLLESLNSEQNQSNLTKPIKENKE